MRRCQANASAEPFELQHANTGPVAAAFTCASRIAAAAASGAMNAAQFPGPARHVNKGVNTTDWGVFLMSDTPVVHALGQADASLQPHLLSVGGTVGHVDQTCSKTDGCGLEFEPGIFAWTMR